MPQENVNAQVDEPVNDQETEQASEPRTFTQEEFDRAFAERMKSERKKHAKELAKFEGFEDLKAKAEKYDELEAAKKSELEKAVEATQAAVKRAEEAERKIADMEEKAAHAALVAKIAEEEGVPASALSGDDEDAIRAHAAAIKEYAESVKPTVPQTNAGGATPAPDDESKLSEREQYAFRVR